MGGKNISQVLPKGDKGIIKDALIQYQKTLDCLIDKFTRENNERMVDQLHETRHDLHSLIGFMEYDVTINLPQKVKDNFVFKHNVDFPLYDEGIKLQYPIEEESKWVTILSGDFTFIDDGVHGRECHVNSIKAIEKYLREDMDGVIDDIERCGESWVVVEDYDGSIEMVHPTKDNREFQVVWLETHHQPTTDILSIYDFNGVGYVSIPEINAMEAGQILNLEGIIIIRLR